LRQLRKRNSSRPLNSKPDGLRRMLFLILQKDRRERFAGIPLHPLIVCSVLVVSLKTTMEKSGYDVRNISDGRTRFVVVRRKILFVSLARDIHCVVLSLYPLYWQFF
jgi:hypothetical protein